MIVTRNAEKSRSSKIKIFLTVEQIVAFASRPNMVREVKNLSLNFKEIA